MQSPTVPPGSKAPRNYFWLSFAIGFVLLAAVSCGGAAILVGFGDISLADLQSSGPAWTPPPALTAQLVDTTAPAAQPPTDGSAGPGQLQLGGSARNVATSRVNIRRTPGYLSKGDEDIVAQMEPGALITILDWPQLRDQLAWWRIRYDAPTGLVEGWVAESTGSGVQILAPE